MSIFEEMYGNRQFQSWRDFHEVERMLAEAISRGFVEEISVMRDFKTYPVHEKWYRDKETDEIYSLVEPDPPARGSWVRVDREDLTESSPAIQ
jgi:hypothetical protein